MILIDMFLSFVVFLSFKFMGVVLRIWYFCMFWDVLKIFVVIVLEVGLLFVLLNFKLKFVFGLLGLWFVERISFLLVLLSLIRWDVVGVDSKLLCFIIYLVMLLVVVICRIMLMVWWLKNCLFLLIIKCLFFMLLMLLKMDWM